MEVPHFVEYVWPSGVTAEDWEELARADAEGPDFYSLQMSLIQAELENKTMHLFRLRPKGVLLVEVRQSPEGKRLGIVRFAGVNTSWQLRALADLLKHTAREWGCQQIETMVYSGKLAKALYRVGARPEAVNMVLEVSDGQ